MSAQKTSAPKLQKKYYTPCLQSLDTVGWEHGFSVSAYGVKIGVRVTDQYLLYHLKTQLPYGCELGSWKVVKRIFSVIAVTDDDSMVTRYNLYWNDMLFALKLTMSELLDRLNSVISIAIAELSKEKVFIHSGVIEWKGKAILLPGFSFSGKSTLVAELVKCGAIYYSDEFAVIDNQGFVTAYPRPLSLRKPGTHQQTNISIEDIGGRIGNSRLPVGLVVFNRYKADANWAPLQLSPGNGLLRLLENTHSTQRSPKRAMKVLKNIVMNARIISTFRGEASHVAPIILREAAW